MDILDNQTLNPEVVNQNRELLEKLYDMGFESVEWLEGEGILQPHLFVR